MTFPSRTADFLTDAEAMRKSIESSLNYYTLAETGCPTRLTEAIQYSLLQGGKRLRPILVLLATDACGGDESSALPIASAVEMIHCYSLIHDDLPAMDDDDLRRGKPTSHKVFGEALAILAGDGLLTKAFEIVAKDTKPTEVAAACLAKLAQAAGVAGMVGGQVDDILDDYRIKEVEQLESIHRRKTGALLTVCLELGGMVALASPEKLTALKIYGQSIGLAFQIVDDLLDVQGDEDKVGKRVRKDLQQGKITYPELLGIEATRDRAKQLIQTACDALAPLRPRSQRLEALAHYILERDH